MIFKGTDLAVGLGSEALPQIKSVFLTQAAAGRAVNDSFSVFVTLKNSGNVGIQTQYHPELRILDISDGLVWEK